MEERLRFLFRKYFDNTCSHDELQEFFDLINKASDDQALRQLVKNVYTELRGTSIETGFVDQNGKLVYESLSALSEKFSSPAERPKTIRRFQFLAIAASAIIAVSAFFLLRTNNKPQSKTATISSSTKKTTNRSESKYVLLEDSTQVWLNAASSLEIPDQFDASKRGVILSGEAFFDVKHADKIPFIIHTGNISTTVLGTAFNIKAYPGQSNVTISVSRGKVKVSRDNRWQATLTMGQQLKLSEKGSAIKEKLVQLDEVAGWQQGNLVYDDETLADIVADMQLIYNINIAVANDAIGALRISTAFKKEIGVEHALQVLCKLTDTELKQKDGVYVIE